MKEAIIQIIAAIVAAVGFSILFSTSFKKIPAIILATTLTWAAYLITTHFTDNVLIANLISAFTAGLLSEILARALRTPVTVFLFPSIIPLVPGSGLYFSMRYLIEKNFPLFSEYIYATVLSALGIASGIMLAAIIGRIIKKPIRLQKIKG